MIIVCLYRDLKGMLLVIIPTLDCRVLGFKVQGFGVQGLRVYFSGFVLFFGDCKGIS